MSIVLTHTTNKIEISYTVSGIKQEIDKGSFRLHLRDDKVWLTFRSASSGVNSLPTIDLSFREVSSPTVASAEALYDLLAAWDKSAYGGIDPGNSTEDYLPGGGVFTGDATSIEAISSIIISLLSDADSAIDGLSIEFSPDGTNWDICDVYNVAANRGKTFSFQPAGKFFRVVYTNGSDPQTFFRLSTIFKSTNVKPSSHRIQDTIIDDDDAELNKAIITGKDNDGNFINFGTRSPQPVIDLNGTAIARGDVDGYSNKQKFGHVEALGVTLQTAWDLPALYSYPPTAIVMTVSSGDVDDQGALLDSGIATDGSTTTLEDTGADFPAAGVLVGDILVNDTNMECGVITNVTTTILTIGKAFDTASKTGDSYRIVDVNDTGAALVLVEGLDADYNEQMEFVILDGQTGVSTIGSYLRMNRAPVQAAGSSGWNEGIIYVGTGIIAIGIPANIYTIIEATKNQTLQAFYTVPAGKTGFLSSWFLTVGTGKEVEGVLVFRPYGKVFQVKQESHLDSVPFLFPFDVPLKAREKTDIEVRVRLTSTPAVAIATSFDLIIIEDEYGFK